eukprot:scaffold13865_cov23-Tisochrysis_lutea.AAC.1
MAAAPFSLSSRFPARSASLRARQCLCIPGSRGKQTQRPPGLCGQPDHRAHCPGSPECTAACVQHQARQSRATHSAACLLLCWHGTLTLCGTPKLHRSIEGLHISTHG